MKNTVYCWRKLIGECMEEFAKELIDFLLRRNTHVSKAEVSVSKSTGRASYRKWKTSPNDICPIQRRETDHKVARAGKAIFQSCRGLKPHHHENGRLGIPGYIHDSLTSSRKRGIAC